MENQESTKEGVMPAPLRIKLDKESKRTWHELSSANEIPVRVKQRAVAVRLNAHDWNVPKIGEYLDWGESTVREAIHP